jgi:WD40 repeat protein
MHTHAHSHSLTHTHTRTHTHTHRYTHTPTHTHSRTYTHAHTDTRTHAHTDTHAHRHSHTYRCNFRRCASCSYFITVITSGHTDAVRAVVISFDCKFVYSGSSDCTIRVWNASNGHAIICVEDMRIIRSLALSGYLLASGGWRKSVDLRNTNVERIKSVHTGLWGHTAIVTSIVIFNDNRRIISGSADCQVRVWDVSNKCECAVLKGHSDEVYSVAVNSDCSLAASASKDRTIRIWDLSSYAECSSLFGHGGIVYAVVFL